MLSLTKIGCASLLVAMCMVWPCASAPIDEKIHDLDWGYGNADFLKPEAWGGVCAEGEQQSPIDLLSEDAEQMANEDFLLFHGYDEPMSPVELVYREYKAELIPLSGTEAIEGGGLKGKYVLESVGLHWSQAGDDGSEHKINGKGYPLELHFIHRLSTAVNMKEPAVGDVAVLAVLAEIVPLTEHVCATVEAIQDALFHPDVVMDKVAGPLSVQLSELLPKDVQSFYRYDGSMTEPDCDEGVVWTVFNDTLKVHRRMLDGLRLMRTVNVPATHTFIPGNVRPLQPFNNRTLLYRQYVAEAGDDGRGFFTALAAAALGGVIADAVGR